MADRRVVPRHTRVSRRRVSEASPSAVPLSPSLFSLPDAGTLFAHLVEGHRLHRASHSQGPASAPGAAAWRAAVSHSWRARVVPIRSLRGHRGFLTLESAPAAFFAHGEAVGVCEVSGIARGRTPMSSLLVIDDEAVLRDVLEDAGYAVLE